MGYNNKGALNEALEQEILKRGAERTDRKDRGKELRSHRERTSKGNTEMNDSFKMFNCSLASVAQWLSMDQ